MNNYRDIDFSLGRLDDKPNGSWINIKNDAYDIIQSVKNIILSSPGEIPFSDFGVGAYDYRYEYLTLIDKQLLESNIKNRVNGTEPRVEINRVNAKQVGEKLVIDLNLTLLLTPKINKTISLTLDPL